VLRAALDAGVDHIDTAQTYGAGGVNELIREALHPYPDGLALVSKVAARRDEAGALLAKDDPDQLRADIEENLTTLGVEQLTAVNLRVMDNDVPDARFVDQLGVLVRARDGDPYPYSPRREPPRLRVVVGRPRHRQPRCGVSVAAVTVQNMRETRRIRWPIDG
jgi:hypothetical protein